MSRKLSLLGLVAPLFGAALAFGYTPITMINADFSTGTAGAFFGGPNPWGITQMKYYTDRNGGTYLGSGTNAPYLGGANTAAGLEAVNTTLTSGYVFVWNSGLVADAVQGNLSYPYFGSSPGVSYESIDAWPPGVQPALKVDANVRQQNTAGDYSGWVAAPYSGSDIPAADVSMPRTLTDAALPGVLNAPIDFKAVYQASSDAKTRISTLGMMGNYGYTTGTAFSTQVQTVAVQMWNGAPTGNVTRSTATGGAADQPYVNQAGDQLGIKYLKLTQYKQSDFDLSATIDVDDAIILSANWDLSGSQTDANFFKGDSDGSKAVDVDDAINLSSQWDLAGDVAHNGADTMEAVYDPATGHITLKTHGSFTTWKIQSTTANLISSALVTTTAGSLPTKTATKIGEFASGGLTQGDFDLGAVAPTGLAVAGGNVPSLSLTAAWLGGSTVVPVSALVVPEPAALGLLALGGLLALRRRAA